MALRRSLSRWSHTLDGIGIHCATAASKQPLDPSCYSTRRARSGEHHRYTARISVDGGMVGPA
ncbi:hypothetical protein CH272_21880 [Rhodococcus sp. 05-340-1]|nr:hypothetical protein CH272_21880 [Rhodococcus sp. 05-340-1]OZF14048.1 hypothetical protein CH297_26625 [Rhodococcus fascians]OZF62533.1 hypothetical protein CH307_26435 [Rhodococcus fascians]